MKRLYFDWNASTPIRPEVLECMREVESCVGNPSSIHAEGRKLRAIIEEARLRVRRALDAGDARVVWTSGASEANNLAVEGFARSAERRGLRKKIVISTIEHSAVLEPAARLESRGWILEKLPVDSAGFVDSNRLASASHDASLVSVILANNEVGTLQPIPTIRREMECFIHTDAAQSLGRIPFSFRSLCVDAATFSAHKLGGPRGVGALLLRSGTPLEPLLRGGDHEFGLRAGTENVAGIAGFALAVEHAVAEQARAAVHMSNLGSALRKKLLASVPGVRFVTPTEGALPNTLAISIRGIDGRALQVGLDLEGVAASIGSACASGSIEPSHVLMAMGFTTDEARTVLRISMGFSQTLDDVSELVERLSRVVARLGA